MNKIFPAILAALSLGLCPFAAQAHPHVFIDASHELLFDGQGRLTAVRSTWKYDEMFTLLMVEDGDYDKNGNGQIDADEMDGFRLWDANWPADYEGDMVLTVPDRPDAPIALGPPHDWAADWQDGRAVSIHTRSLETPLDMSGGLLLRAYEPDYFAAYTIVAPPEMTGRDDCTAQVISGDENAVPDDIAEKISNLDMGLRPEDVGLPQVGALYSDAVRVTCAP